MIAVPLRAHRRQRFLFIQKLQHAAPVFMLLPDGLTRLRENPHGESLLLGGAEVAVSALVIGSVLRAYLELRTPASPTPRSAHARHGVDWLDICLGAMLVVEAVLHQHETGHLPRPTIAMAVVMMALGLSHGKRFAWGDKRRALRMTDEGISVPGRFFTRTRFAWADVAAVTIDANEAGIVGTDGRRRRIGLVDAATPDTVRQALEYAASRVQALDTPSLPLL